VPKGKHLQMLDVITKLGAIYKRHGSLGMELYVWGETTIFQGFAGLQEKLGATPDDELWIEIDSYKDSSHLARVVQAVGGSKEPAQLWQKLSTLVGPGRSIAMGEFQRLSV
jgi:hypothetical protein